jgi:multiple sugar transport system substrate-binding protein
MKQDNRISRRDMLKLLGGATAAGALKTISPYQIPTFNINRLLQTKTLQILAHSSPQTESYRRAGAAFKQKTGIDVNITEVPFNELQVKMMTELVAKTGKYDVVPITNAMMYPASQYLEDATALLTDELKKDLSPASVEAMRDLQGTLRGLPTQNSLPANFYRTDLMDKAKVKPPTTWNEFIEVCKALTFEASGNQPKVWGALIEASAKAVQPGFKLTSWFYQAGGSLADADMKPAVNTDPNIEALQFVVDLINKHKVAAPESAEMTYEDVHNLFMQGRGATAINWQYMVSLASSSDQSLVKGKFAVAPVPAGKVKGVAVDQWGLVIPKDSSNKDAAMQFVAMALTKEQQQDLLKSEGLVARFSAMDPTDPVVKAANPFIDAWNEELKWAKPLPKWEQIQDVMLRISVAMNTAVTGAASPKQALDDAQKEITALIVKK